MATGDNLVISGYLIIYKMKMRMGANCKYWAELHRETSQRPRELRLFQSREKADSNSMMHDQSIKLHNVLEVCDKKQRISGRPVFQIIFSKCKHQLLAENTEEMERWIVALQQEIFGLPIQEVTYEFQVGVLNNPAAKRYNLLGNYTAKIDDKNFALYSASGLISTNFSVNISDIWRVKVAPECTNITVDSNFVVIDIRCGGALLLMSECSTDIARIINHRRRLLNSCSQLFEASGEVFSPPYHGSPAMVRKFESKFDYSNPKAKGDDYLELQIDSSTSSTSDDLKRQSQEHLLSKSVNIPRSQYLTVITPKSPKKPKVKPKPLNQQSRQSSSDEPDPSTEATDSQKTTTMSKRPPEPVPRPVESEAWKSSKSYSTGVVHICKISSGEDLKSSYGYGDNGYVIPNGGQNDGKYIYPYVLQTTPMRRATVYNEPDYVSEQKIMEFRKQRTRHASLEELNDIGSDRKDWHQPPKNASNDDAIFNSRRLMNSTNKHTSLKGSKSFDDVYS